MSMSRRRGGTRRSQPHTERRSCLRHYYGCARHAAQVAHKAGVLLPYNCVQSASLCIVSTVKQLRLCADDACVLTRSPCTEASPYQNFKPPRRYLLKAARCPPPTPPFNCGCLPPTKEGSLRREVLTSHHKFGLSNLVV